MTDWTPDPRFRHDANLSILYGALPWAERPDAAAADGYDAVESWWPFGSPVPGDREVDRFVGSLAEAGTRLVLLNLDGGDLAGGDRGLACDPGQRTRFADNLAVVAGIVAATGCLVVNALYGNRVDGLDPAAQEAVAVENLALAVGVLSPLGATVVVEPLNLHDCPRYPLTTADAVVAVLDRVPCGPVAHPPALLLDVYHLTRMAQDLVAAVHRHGPRIGHVQLADVPGRGRPGTGTIDFGAVQDALAAVGYRGHLGLEHLPG